MSLKAQYYKHRLKFKFEAGTSRGVLTERDTFLIKLWDSENPSIFGLGEASPLYGLSIDFRPDFEKKLKQFCEHITPPVKGGLGGGEDFPSIRFAFETAWLDLQNDGKRIIYPNEFSQGNKSLIINGLVWMGKPAFMQAQIEEKLNQGFHCLKMKIGAIDFESELSLLKAIRQKFSSKQITLRVDANGAFSPQEASEKLEKLAELEIHSIEQPIRAGQVEAIAKLCQNTPLPIALDEELIGKFNYFEKEKLLQVIYPQYIIIKPTLLGGFSACEEWIEIAEKLKIAWWMTSALEANIGLNAISQFTAQFDNPLPQGLGTGSLYHNNFASPLSLQGENLWYQKDEKWEIPVF